MQSQQTAPAALNSGVMGQIVQDVIERLERGEEVDAGFLESAYPDAADCLAEVLPTIRALMALRGRESGALDRGSGDGMPIHCVGAPVPATLGDFRIVRQIGRGGMGIVYEAEQVSLGRRVALKVLPLAGMLEESTLARFKIEARAAATLEHPHIVHVYGSGEEQGIYYYAMQLIRGWTLADVIAELRGSETGDEEQGTGDRGQGTGDREGGTGGNGGNGENETKTGTEASKGSKEENQHDSSIRRLNSDQWLVRADEDLGGMAAPVVNVCRTGLDRRHSRRVAEMGVQVAEALAHAHAQGIVHRDIKPSNLLVDENDKVWVTDFGLAAIDDSPPLTMTGDFMGTLRYMSPEQAAGDRDAIDGRADIYSLGATLYELLTLRPAFEGKNRAALLHDVLHRDPLPPSAKERGVPASLEAIVLKAMSKQPGERYASANALADDLRRFLERKRVTARRRGGLSRGWQSIRKHGRAIVSVLAISIVVLGGVWGTQYLVLGTPSRDDSSVTPYASQSTDLKSSILNAKSNIPNPELPFGPIPAPSGLIAWWSGDGHAEDYAGEHDGKLMNGATFAPGLVGEAFSLDGIDDYIRVSHDDALNPTAGFTIEGWVRFNSTWGWANIVSKWNLVTQDYSYSLQCTYGNRRRMFFLSEFGRGDLAILTGNASSGSGVWHHVAATYDLSTVRLYSNGTLDASQSVDSGRFIQASMTDVLIGASTDASGLNSFFGGQIDELSIYNRALSAAEIQAIVQAGAAGKIKPMHGGQ